MTVTDSIQKTIVDYLYNYKDDYAKAIKLYEKYGFEYSGIGYHPWGESSRIYKKTLFSVCPKK